MPELKLYEYSGAVMLFDRVIHDKWYAQTRAVSPEKAKTNLVYRYKQENDVGGKISLPSKIREIAPK